MRATPARVVAGLLIAGVGVWGAWTANAWRPEDGLYTVAAFGLVSLFALLSAIGDWRRGSRTSSGTREPTGDGAAGSGGLPVSAGVGDEVAGGAVPGEERMSRDRALRLVAVTALTCVYVLVWDAFGYGVPTVLYVLAMLLTLGVRSRLLLVATPLGVTGFILVVFGELLNIPFP